MKTSTGHSTTTKSAAAKTTGRSSARRASRGAGSRQPRRPNDRAPSSTPSSKSSRSGTSSGYEYDLDALQEREPWAVQEWIVSQQPFLRRVLVHHGVQKGELAELTQEVFCRAIESLPSFSGKSKITTWLYSIARHVAYSRSRKEQRQQEMEPKDLMYMSASHGEGGAEAFTPGDGGGGTNSDDPWIETVRNEKRSLIERGLEQLPDHYAEIIRLRDLQEQSTAETATALSISRGNARVRLHRARKKLRKVLGPYFTGDRAAP